MPDEWHSILAAWLGTYLLHSTLLLGGVWLAVSVLKRLSDEIKEVLWKTALVGGVVTATLQVSLNLSPLAGSVVIAERKTPAMSELLSVEETASPPAHTGGELAAAMHAIHGAWFTLDTHAEEAAGALFDEPPALADATEDSPLPPSVPPADAAVQHPGEEVAVSPLHAAAWSAAHAVLTPFMEWRAVIDWRTLLPAAALLAGLLALGLSLLGRGRLRARLARRVRIGDGPLFDMLQSLTRRAKLRRPVRLTCSNRINSPIAFGMLRGEICLPERVIEELDPQQQETLLAHELAHLIRRDPLWLTLCQILETLLLVQPLNRLARRRIQELAELACDDWAVRQTGLRSSLARCLTEVAMWMAHAPRRPSTEYAVAMAGSPSALRRRVVRLLGPERKQSAALLRRWAMVGGVSVLGLAALLLPSVSNASGGTTSPADPREVETSGEGEASCPAWVSLQESLAALDEEMAALADEIAQLRGAMEDLPADDELAELVNRFDLQMESLGRRRDLLRAWIELDVGDSDDPADGAFTADDGSSRRPAGVDDEITEN